MVDRGIQSANTMRIFDDRQIKFIIRLKENRNFEEIESFLDENNPQKDGDWVIVKDSKVQLYGRKLIKNKQGKEYYKTEKIETYFRLVIIKNEETGKEFWFISNKFDLSAKEISAYYRKRWDIEVFFRFLKQELNLSHLVSMSKNGIEVMIYMTMIAAIMLLLYKKANNLGYTTAKRRIALELRELITAIMIVLSGGDPGKVYKT